MKYRVLIRAFTARRDVFANLFLARTLERMGCAAVVTGVRDFERYLRLWKPHAVVVNTIGMAQRAKRIHPNACYIYLDGEGFLPPGMSLAEYWAKNPEWYDNLDLVLVWGERIVEEVKEFAPNLDRERLHVVGNPKLDLVRFLPKPSTVLNERNVVGAVTRFHNLNDHEGHSPIRRLPKPGNAERLTVQMKSFVAMIEAIEVILHETKYSVEIRPHPSEQIDSYKAYIREWFGKYSKRVSVDESLDFASWASTKRALISPSSTTFLEAYLLGVPVINLDRISGIYEYSASYADVIADWQKSSLVPENNQQLVEILTKLPQQKVQPDIEKQLAEYCDWTNSQSANLRAAGLIVKLLEGMEKARPLHLPRAVLDVLGEISFRRAMRRNPLHYNFNYRNGYHDIPDHLEEMISNAIVSSR